MKKLKPRSAHAAARGPNGRPTQYNGRGELVEKNIDEHGQKFDLLIGRSHSDIKKRHRHCSDRVWFKQHQEVLRSAETNEGQFDEKQRAMLEKAQERVRRIESEYSNELLSFDDLSFAYLCGQLAALAWVLGAGDEDCLDT